MKVWKMVFHTILKIFHSIPFWHFPYSIPKFPFHSIPFFILFHSIPCLDDIRCESTKITEKHFLLANSRAVNTNLGVLRHDLHSNSLEPVNFFGAQSSLWGAQAVIWGGTAPECSFVAPGLEKTEKGGASRATSRIPNRL